MKPGAVPPIAPTDLRDHASPARIERIWRRIERDLPIAEPVSRPSRSRTVWAVAAAATFAAFGGGLVLGRATMHRHVAEAPEAVASPEHVATDVFAAGSHTRTVSLPGGGALTLAPGTTVEVERADGLAMILRLVQGEASVDVAKAPKDKALDIIAGEAKLSTRSGSIVHVKRRTDDMDVAVTSGMANLSEPGRELRQLRSGEHAEAVPLHYATTSQQPTATNIHGQHLPLAITSADVPPVEAPPLIVAASADWKALAKDATKWKEALELLRQQPNGVAGAIKAATSADELMMIGDVARSGDLDGAINAYSAVTERFPDSNKIDIATYYLGDSYARLKQYDKAQAYLAKVHGSFAELALYRRFTIAAKQGHKNEAIQLATEYVNKYPNGGYKDEADRVRNGDGDAAKALPSSDATP